MNKSDFLAAVAEHAEVTKADAGRTVEAMIAVIKKAMQQGDSLTLPGFGTFTVRERAARAGRNPQTGETMQIKASKSPAFKPGKDFKNLG